CRRAPRRLDVRRRGRCSMARGSPVRWLVGIAIALVVAFVGSTILAQRNARLLDVRSTDISDNAAPSINELAASRSEMRRLELAVGRYLGTHLAGLRENRAELDRLRTAVDAHLRAYRDIPMFADEVQLSNELDAARQRVDDDIGRALAAVDNGRVNEARTFILDTLTD